MLDANQKLFYIEISKNDKPSIVQLIWLTVSLLPKRLRRASMSDIGKKFRAKELNG